MYTGIVQACVPVVRVENKPGLTTYAVEIPEALVAGLASGDSVSIDGVCQTVVRIDSAQVTFDAMEETLRKTTISSVAEGRRVNVERSAKAGDEIGGHALAGHVSGTAEIVAVQVSENNRTSTFRVPAAWMNYIFPQGFIALDGASLTIVDVDREQATFRVSFIPETLKRTTFGAKGVGDLVNVEIDSRTQIIVDTVERVLAQMSIKPRPDEPQKS
jgi:riboflavin synthase